MTRRTIESWLMDMDGVLVHEEDAIPGADRFLAGLETILVLTGVATRESAERFPFRPSRILESVADLATEIEALPAAE